MRKSRFTPEQIVKILQEVEAGGKISEVSRRHGVSEMTFHRWRRFGRDQRTLGPAIGPAMETSMPPRFLSLALALAAVLSLPPQARAQISPGLHLARAADSFDGVNGVGGSLQLSLPVLPVDLFFAGEYFFPNCDDCSFWGGSADVHFTLPVPLLTPYGTGGLVVRNTDASDTRVRTGGLGLGAGVNLSTVVVGAYAEGRYELMDGSGDQLVFRLGLRF